ncbi:octaprenyl diphosphate synthase [Achromatium sp. WMS3]|nr:octaprenyl diphosphate synthase [Achromatium sp. WMS3]
MNLSDIRELIFKDLQAVNTLILQALASDVILINQIGRYIIQSGGKRLRPMAVLLAAHACDYMGTRHIDLAAIIELIHTATLLHDDVVDASELRRNQETANALWGNEASVLVGDFLYSRAFEMMVHIGPVRVMEVFAQATNRIAEGEVLQLLNCNNPDITEASYLEVVERKTATLFEAGTRLGAVLAGKAKGQEEAMAQYGKHLGIAFQLTDDILDYNSNNPELGKNVGDDLAEGKPTLPLIRAMATGNSSQCQIIRNAIERSNREQLNIILETIANTDAIEYAQKIASQEAQQARESLKNIPPSPYVDALLFLADFAVDRTY